jgi:hypothetical protein
LSDGIGKRAHVFLTNDGIIQSHLAKKPQALDYILPPEQANICLQKEVFL